MFAVKNLDQVLRGRGEQIKNEKKIMYGDSGLNHSTALKTYLNTIQIVHKSRICIAYVDLQLCLTV